MTKKRLKTFNKEIQKLRGNISDARDKLRQLYYDIEEELTDLDEAETLLGDAMEILNETIDIISERH